eukprot:1160464-Pelagomonas_calceolata.AAC.16
MPWKGRQAVESQDRVLCQSTYLTSGKGEYDPPNFTCEQAPYLGLQLGIFFVLLLIGTAYLLSDGHQGNNSLGIPNLIPCMLVLEVAQWTCL